MASRPLSDYTVEELQVAFKKLTVTCGVLIAFFGLLLVGMVVYAQFNPDFKLIVPVIALVCCIIPGVGIQMGNRAKIAKELKARAAD